MKVVMRSHDEDVSGQGSEVPERGVVWLCGNAEMVGRIVPLYSRRHGAHIVGSVLLREKEFCVRYF